MPPRRRGRVARPSFWGDRAPSLCWFDRRRHAANAGMSAVVGLAMVWQVGMTLLNRPALFRLGLAAVASLAWQAPAGAQDPADAEERYFSFFGCYEVEVEEKGGGRYVDLEERVYLTLVQLADLSQGGSSEIRRPAGARVPCITVFECILAPGRWCGAAQDHMELPALRVGGGDVRCGWRRRTGAFERNGAVLQRRRVGGKESTLCHLAEQSGVLTPGFGVGCSIGECRRAIGEPSGG